MVGQAMERWPELLVPEVIPEVQDGLSPEGATELLRVWDGRRAQPEESD